MTPCIVGWSHTQFGKLADETLESLIVRAGREALHHAGVEPKEVSAVYVSAMNNGFSKQDFVGGLALQIDPALRFARSTRVENACASGSAAVATACRDMASDPSARFILVIGAEKMTAVSNAAAGEILLGASYRRESEHVRAGFAGVFGKIANAYFARHGDQRETLARIAARSHRNGALNPYAHLRRDLGFDFCNTPSEQNPEVAGPLRRTDCSPVSDGAAAIVLAREETASGMRRSVRIRAFSHVNDFLPLAHRDPLAFEGPRRAWRDSLLRAGLVLDDLDLVETHDCFTIAELIEYEAMGLAPAGRGRIVVDEGWAERGGRLPINVSGGLKAKGHPIGATGVSMQAVCAMQLCGEAGAMQAPGATLAGIFNMGGLAVANYVFIQERVV